MCGILGIYNKNKEPVSKELLTLMAKSILHRGPDGQKIFTDNEVGLGHCRLSIIDMSEAGNQPMSNEDGNILITYNGEVYNFQELRRQLEELGHKFKSKTDTEVILHGYEQWGEKCLDKFNGMFAFAIFDRTKRHLFLARDRMGKKPLYYYLDDNKFVFASEIKAILQDQEIKRDINNQGMVNYFTFGHSVGKETIYKGIKKLLPGHYLIFKNNEIEINEYWDIECFKAENTEGLEKNKKAIFDLFEDSVKQRLVSDAPLGVFLSGGIDSASVVALMAKCQVGKIKTFSVGFNYSKEFNELADAKFIAKYFKTEHYELLLDETDLSDIINKLVYHFDEPFGDAANFPVFCISKFARNYIKVALTGEGGDEIFAGYRRYVVEKNLKKLFLLKLLLKQDFVKKGICSMVGLRRIKQFAQTLPIENDLLRHTNWLVCFSDDMKNQFFSKDLLVENIDPFKTYKKVNDCCTTDDLLKKMMYLDQKVLLPDCYLEKIDKATMANGLEARSPFLDYRLVELANKIPSKYKIKGVNTKYIFKKSMENILPKQVFKKKKHGFAVPTDIWLKGKLKNYLTEIIFDSKTRKRGYFNYDYIEKIYKEYQDNNQPFGYQFWLMLNFELWHRQFIDK